MESPEYKAWVECFAKLQHGISQSPDGIATQLRPLRILAKEDIEFIGNPILGRDKRAEKIVDVIQNKLEDDPKMFNKILRALRDAGPWIYKTVKELQETYDRFLKNTESSQDQLHTTGSSTGNDTRGSVSEQQRPENYSQDRGGEKVKFTDLKRHESGEGLSTSRTKDYWKLEKIHKLKLASFSGREPETNINGKGIKIAVLDTGLFVHHKDIRDKLSQIRIYNFVKDDSGETKPHKTAVTIPSDHCTAAVSLIFQIAPKATVYVMRIATSVDLGWKASYVTTALEFIKAMKTEERPDIVSMSCSFPFKKYSKWKTIVDDLEKVGTICVAATGNDGAYHDEIPAPACLRKVISVGSTTPKGQASDSNPETRNIDVFAPGEGLQAPCLPEDYEHKELDSYSVEVDEQANTVVGTNFPIAIADDCRTTFSGSSVATPKIAGLLALLFQYADSQTRDGGRSTKIRHCEEIMHVLTTQVQDNMQTVILRPYKYFKQKHNVRE